MSRPQSRTQPATIRLSSASSRTDNHAQPQVDLSDLPSDSTSPRRTSEASEGYPSWLPKRPAPPGPESIFQSTIDRPNDLPFTGGRRPTPRHLRVVSILDTSQAEKGPRRETADQTRVSNFLEHRRVWSRATSMGITPTLFSSEFLLTQVNRPTFRAKGLHLDILRNPSWTSRLYFFLLPLFTFAHIPLQSFLDFNVVFILLQVSKFPNKDPGSGRNWALGAAAYTACWLAWILIVFIGYELVYSFWRRWRIKCPSMFPLYLSSPGYNLVSMTSYLNFCFMRYVRHSAFASESGSLRDGLAETFWFYSQNLPTVALLLPRAGLSIALLFAFSSPEPGIAALANQGISHRDGTFFRTDNGTLTRYAKGILLANAAWTGWRLLVLWFSLVGLWIVSGQGCAGICGPRFRWEEEEVEKAVSAFNDTGSHDDPLPWSWKVSTRMRVQAAFDFCLLARHPGKKPALRAAEDAGDAGADDERYYPTLPEVQSSPTFEGVEKILEAIGFPASPPPARRPVLTEELFQTPPGTTAVHGRRRRAPSSSSSAAAAAGPSTLPQVFKRASRERTPVAGPSTAPLYPFAARGAQISSQDRIPFPHSARSSVHEPSVASHAMSESPVASGNGAAVEGRDEVGENHEAEEEEEEDGDDDDDDEEEEEEEEEEEGGSEERSSGPGSTSMSSLGHQVTSRYPFQLRMSARGSLSSGGHEGRSRSRGSPSTFSRSTNSPISRTAQASRQRESLDSQSPRSGDDSSSGRRQLTAALPMPPRRVRTQQRSVPSPVYPPAPAPSSMVFPHGNGARTRAESEPAVYESAVYESAVGEEEIEDYGDDFELEQLEAEGSHVEGEEEDAVGLLSASSGSSPRASYTNVRTRTRSLLSGSGSNPRSDSHSGSSPRSRAVSFSRAVSARSRSASISNAARSRAQSLIRAASRSSSELLVHGAIRSRANSSMARLEEDVPYPSGVAAGLGGSPPSPARSSPGNGHRRPRMSLAPRATIEASPTLGRIHRRDSPVRLSSLAFPVLLRSVGASPPPATDFPTSPGPGLGPGESAAASGTEGSERQGESTPALSFVTSPATLEDAAEGRADHALGSSASSDASDAPDVSRASPRPV